jgi:rfaE bifunctional protein kinase chain/domain
MLTTEQITSFFEALPTKKILIVGDVMIDAYIWGHVDRISPEAPVPVVKVNKRSSMLGGAANVALNVKALGAHPLLCSVIGYDNRGDEFLHLLEQEDITGEGIIRSKKRLTTTKFRVIGNSHQLIRVDEEADNDLDEEEYAKLFYRFEKLLSENQFDAIIIQDYNKGVLSLPVINRIITTARERGIPLTVDPKKRNFDHYRDLMLFKPNLKELLDGCRADINIEDMEALRKTVLDFQQERNIMNILVTLSERGVFLSAREKDTINTYHIPAHIRTIADVSGAGDTVVSVAALCMVSHFSPYDTATISNLAGGLVCEYVGVVPVNKNRLIKEVKGLYCID